MSINFDTGELEPNPQDIDCPQEEEEGEELDSCPNCGNVECPGDCFPSDPDDSLDGDAATALASAGFGTDEDYGGGDTPLGEEYGGE